MTAEDITVDFANRVPAWKWAVNNGIDIHYYGTVSKDASYFKDIWRIKNERHRMLFALRWA